MSELDLEAELARVGEAVSRRFDAQRRVLGFAEYLELLGENPWRHTRDAARYLRDCFDHWGTEKVRRPWGEVTRFKLFDLPFADTDGRRNDRLVGHEELQRRVYRALAGFQREGRANRLLLLHGPNGSAKSTFAACLMAGLEAYSETDEGALYRFSWVFPRGTDGKGIGFTTEEGAPPPGDTYAHLPEERIDAKLPSEIREHPLLLLPLQERRVLLRKLYADIDTAPPDWLWSGELGHKNRQIYEALLTAYRGDLQRALAHVQVERFYISRRYRLGAVTIGPQMAVDARERQITADRSLGALPASLSALTLFETFGELVDAESGVIEYSDLLKRPLDAWKYLLLAIESGEVALPMSNLPINAVMVASSNELHLEAFRQHPEYHSFRGRLVLLRVPYLRDHRQEQGIYDAQIVPQVRRHVAPHVTHLAALWAVLTRLKRAQAPHYGDRELGKLAADLTPMEKAALYADGTVPRRLDGEESKTLAEGIGDIYAERSGQSDYEGGFGASPREMRMVLLDAASDPEERSLSPVALFDRLTSLCERGEYAFTQMESDRGYHDASGFVSLVREHWLDLVDDELRGATGLVEETQYLELFDRYVSHASNAMKGEQIYNPVTGKHEEPDSDLMENVEEMLGAKDHEAFRRDLMSAVANWAIENPDEPVDYQGLFPRYMEKLEEAYYEQHKKQIEAIARDILTLVDPAQDRAVDPERKAVAEAARSTLETEHGYAAASLQTALDELLKARYEE
jgi:serine protein kinase